MSDWMTIRVVLAGRADEPLTPPPGRVLLAHAEHAFADLAEAVDTAFGRWDLTPVHAFDVDGRRLLSAGAGSGEEDADAEDSEEVTLGEARLRAGSRFAYVFDLGEGWEHECSVEEVDVDPVELAGEEPEVPVPVFGWGSIPDQYGRSEEDEDDDLDEALDDDDIDAEDDDAAEEDAADAEPVDAAPLLADDEEEDDLLAADADEEEEDWDGWDEAERSSWEVVRRALTDVERQPDPLALAEVATSLREGEGGSEDDAIALLRAAAEPEDLESDDDEELWTALAAAVVSPLPMDLPLDPDTAAAWLALEPADFAGAVIELIRSGPGTTADPEALIELIERCPEIEGEELSESDEAIILAGLEVVVRLWRALGALDADGTLTPLGVWGLPRSLERAWSGGA
jgi:hypothetical protein